MDKRKKRVKRIKIILIVLFVVFLLLPTLLCVILFMKVNRLSSDLEKLMAMRAMKVYAAEDEKPAGTDGAETEAGASSGEEEKEPSEDAADSNEMDSGMPAEAEESPLPGEEQDVRRVYLTFDDGPGKNTEAILEILGQYQVKATFFVVGKTDDESRRLYRQIVEEGHTLAMHSYSHQYATLYASLKAFKKDYKKISSLLEEATGVEPKFYRFPGGSSNQVSGEDMKVFIDYLNKLEVTYFDWNVESGDAVSDPPGSEQICENVLQGVTKYRNAIVLMHDLAGKESTVEALPAIIEALQEQGFELCPIDEATTPVQHVVSDRKSEGQD